MWLLLGLALADSADTGDSAEAAPYRDTAFVVTSTYEQTSHACGGGQVGAAAVLAALFMRFGARRAATPGS